MNQGRVQGAVRAESLKVGAQGREGLGQPPLSIGGQSGVAAGHPVHVHGQAMVGFQVLKLQHAATGQGQFRGVQNLEGDDFPSPGRPFTQNGHPSFQGGKKIGGEENQSPAGKPGGDFPKGPAQVGGTGGRRGFQKGQQAGPRGRARTGRQKRPESIAQEAQGAGVPLAKHDVGDGGEKLSGVVDFGPATLGGEAMEPEASRRRVARKGASAWVSRTVQRSVRA